MTQEYINDQVQTALNHKNVSDLETEETIYQTLISIRKLFHKGQDRVEFHQFWQQKQAVKDIKTSIALLKRTKQYVQEDKKDKQDNNILFILPNLNKVIVIDFYSILRTQYLKRYKGWVEYSEQEIK